MENWVQVPFHSQNIISIFPMAVLQSTIADLYSLVPPAFLSYQQRKSSSEVPEQWKGKIISWFSTVWAHHDTSKCSINPQLSPRPLLLTKFSGTRRPTRYFTNVSIREAHIWKNHLTPFKITIYYIYRLLKCTKFLQTYQFWRKLWSIWSVICLYHQAGWYAKR